MGRISSTEKSGVRIKDGHDICYIDISLFVINLNRMFNVASGGIPLKQEFCKCHSDVALYVLAFLY